MTNEKQQPVGKLDAFEVPLKQIIDYIHTALNFTGEIRGTQCFLTFDLIGEISDEIKPFTKTIQRNGHDVVILDVWRVIEDMASDPETNALPEGKQLIFLDMIIAVDETADKNGFSRRHMNRSHRNPMSDIMLGADPEVAFSAAALAKGVASNLYETPITYIVACVYKRPKDFASWGVVVIDAKDYFYKEALRKSPYNMEPESDIYHPLFTSHDNFMKWLFGIYGF